MKRRNDACERCAEKKGNENSKKVFRVEQPIYVPVGCRACGGPYPMCRTSCPMFDE